MWTEVALRAVGSRVINVSVATASDLHTMAWVSAICFPCYFGEFDLGVSRTEAMTSASAIKYL